MNIGEMAGEWTRRAGYALQTVTMTIGSVLVSTSAHAQEAAASAAPEAASSYTPMTPTPGIGMPVDGAIGLQKQFSTNGEYGAWMHNSVLMPLITAISLFVLLLLVIVAVRFNKRANPVPSKTSHNTFIEVVWTLLPVLILVGIAVPSISLIAKQYRAPDAKAVTVKVTGNQWYWTYAYPDNGGFEVISNMLNVPGQPVVNNGIREAGSQPYDGPALLEVDNRMVVPVGEDIRIQTIGADVIHSFAIPSLWFKIDAVPGRINERVLRIEKEGVYYGQCSELCGARHAYMPIAIEVVSREKFNAWVKTHPGGVIDGQAKKPEAAAPAGPSTDASASAPAA